jgi:pyruvate formate lyase activating enzyme
MTGSATSTTKALVFDIQRLSLDDGPGIRTSVFFKGCPLRCLWCHNPEGLEARPELLYRARACVGCGACVKACAAGVHSFALEEGRRVHLVNHAACSLNAACLEVCCYDALEIAGRRYSVDELLAEIEGDRAWFGSTGGGITLTGGEPMMQAGFIEELIARAEGIGICMETSGFAPTADFLKVMGGIELFLFDYKATDPRKHRELCGIDNELILANLGELCARGAKVELRLPLVPGVNDDDEHFEGIARILREHPSIERAKVMPYHNMGSSKAEELGRVGYDAPSATGAQVEAWIARLRALGAENVA